MVEGKKTTNLIFIALRGLFVPICRGLMIVQSGFTVLKLKRPCKHANLG